MLAVVPLNLVIMTIINDIQYRDFPITHVQLNRMSC